MWRIKLPYFLEGFLMGLVIFGTIFVLSCVFTFLKCDRQDLGCGIVVGYVLYFSVIGIAICTIIGWIYGKTKSKK
jgi:tryptophan-rich sensory protein